VILYHFTSFYNLKNVGPENILAVGLKAMPVKNCPEGVIRQLRCVWLTTNSDLPPIFSSHAEVRIKLVIPSSDRRLVHLPNLLRKRLSPEQLARVDAETDRAGRTFYVFFGDIPLDRFRAVEYADAARRAEMISVDPGIDQHEAAARQAI